MLGMLIASLLCSSTESGVGEVPVPPANLRKLGVTIGLGLDTQLRSDGRIANVALWGEVELNFRLLRWLRLDLLTGGAWSPENRPTYPGQHGAFRALAGADFLLAFRWGDLFVGAAAGIQHTNLFGDEDWPSHVGYSTPWGTGLCLLSRAGVDFRLLDHLSIGGAFAYSFFTSFEIQHSGEVRARLTLQF